MRKGLLIAVLVLVCGCFAVAQDYPKASIFGGVSLLHLDTEGATDATVSTFFSTPGSTIKTWYPGWEVAGQYNFTKLLGVKADFSGNYGTPLTVPGVSTPSARTYSFLFGPVLSLRGEHATPFVHALFGGNHLSIDAAPGATGLGNPAITETAFAMAFGGGVDMKLTRHFGLRLGQFDYLYTKHCINVGGACTLGVAGAPTDHQNNFRFATGVTIAP
jgi:opacity protein-like surface antigen